MEYFITGSLVLLVLFLIFFMVRARANFWLTLIVIPWMLFTMGFGFMVYEASKGYATKQPLPESQFLYSKVIKVLDCTCCLPQMQLKKKWSRATSWLRMEKR